MDIYCDIHPFVETSILLGSNSDSAEDRYINANRIKSPYGEPDDENLMIAAQGPIDSSIRGFWKMAVQENVGMIVTLVQKIPGDCHQYFPTSVNQTETRGEMRITLNDVDKSQNFVVRRDFTVEDTRTS